MWNYFSKRSQNVCVMSYYAVSSYTEARGSEVYLEPASVEEELQQCEDGHVEVQVMTWAALSRVEELAADQTSKEEGVDGESDDLRANDRETLLRQPPSLCVGAESGDLVTVMMGDEL